MLSKLNPDLAPTRSTRSWLSWRKPSLIHACNRSSFRVPHIAQASAVVSSRLAWDCVHRGVSCIRAREWIPSPLLQRGFILTGLTLPDFPCTRRRQETHFEGTGHQIQLLLSTLLGGSAPVLPLVFAFFDPRPVGVESTECISPEALVVALSAVSRLKILYLYFLWGTSRNIYPPSSGCIFSSLIRLTFDGPRIIFSQLPCLPAFPVPR